MDIPLHLDRSRPQPLHRQLYDQIRQGIENERLPPGTRMPPSRELAARLRIGRNTVIGAYDRLVAEGFLVSRPGAWIAVSASPPSAEAERRPAGRPDDPRSTPPQRWLSRRMRAFPTTDDFRRVPLVPVEYDFRPATTFVPLNATEWQRIVARHWTAFDGPGQSSIIPEGDPRLRTQIARYLGAARAVNCAPEQIVVTNSDQQALTLIAHLTLDFDDQILMEDPGPIGSRLVFQAYGAVVVPVPVDADGVDATAAIRVGSRRSRLLNVTPSHQEPTGATLSLDRRLQLLDWAAATDTLIIEDDRNSEYRYGGATIPSLQGLDSHGVVLYVGSLKQLVGGAVQVAYLVVPPPLRPSVSALERVIDKGPPSSVQAALAEFMASRLFPRHLRRMQRHHRVRRDALRDALRACFGDDVTIGPAAAGTHIHVRWHRHPASPTMIDAALRAQIGLVPAAPFYLQPPPGDPGVMMFYGGLDEDRIREGVQRLADLFSGPDSHPA